MKMYLSRPTRRLYRFIQISHRFATHVYDIVDITMIFFPLENEFGNWPSARVEHNNVLPPPRRGVPM